jgi:hypothetical protein
MDLRSLAQPTRSFSGTSGGKLGPSDHRDPPVAPALPLIAREWRESGNRFADCDERLRHAAGFIVGQRGVGPLRRT